MRFSAGQLASGAETGWDFSSRWLRDAQNISSIATSAIVPVDLNAILYKVEVELAALHDAVGLTNASLQYSRRAAQRKSDVERVLWDQNRSMWADFNLTCRCKTNFMFASQFVPVYAGLADDWSNVTAESWSNQLIRGSWFDHFSGVPTSLMQSGQQWDFPNVWPPLVSMATFGLRRIGQHALAFHIAQSFVNSSYVGWADSPNHYMFEKYDARTVGQSGSGGEYVPQNGFGWTNGVVLELLVNFTSLKAPLLRDSTIQAMTSAVVVDYSDGGASSSGINSSTTAAPKPEVTKVDESGWSSPMIIALGCGATIAIVVGATLWVKGACTESITPVVNAAKPNDVDDHEDVEMTYLCPSSSEITYEDEDDAPILQ